MKYAFKVLKKYNLISSCKKDICLALAPEVHKLMSVWNKDTFFSYKLLSVPSLCFKDVRNKKIVLLRTTHTNTHSRIYINIISKYACSFNL